MLHVLVSAQRHGQDWNEGVANQTSQQFPEFGASQEPYFLVRLLGPKRLVTELYIPAILWSSAVSGYLASGHAPGCPGQSNVLVLKKNKMIFRGENELTVFSLVSSSSEGMVDPDLILETRLVK